MKNLYVNSRLHPLLLAARQTYRPRTWIFSQGEPWLFLSPGRLARLAGRLGLGDARVGRLVELACRHAVRPELYCRRIGIAETRRLDPAAYPPALCPSCDGLHFPHPDDAGQACPECRSRDQLAARALPPAGRLRDRDLDRQARLRIRRHDPAAFRAGVLSPGHRKLRVHRDWDKAVGRILMGGRYRDVAKEFSCSVGLLHNKVKEHRYWENN